jgi:(p)ppGpp synthase/HD superfamily hydrolase
LVADSAERTWERFLEEHGCQSVEDVYAAVGLSRAQREVVMTLHLAGCDHPEVAEETRTSALAARVLV